jgi:putative DNA primase/helicase
MIERAPDLEQRGHEPLEAPHLTDLGNARRLVGLYGHDFRYLAPDGPFLAWDGARFADDSGEIQLMRWAKETICAIYPEAAYSYADDATQRRALIKHATASESVRALRGMVTLARSEPGVPVRPDQLDADPWLLNVLNGTLDLRSQELRPHRREDLITKLVPINYEPAAPCPTWGAFLDRVLDGNQRLVGFMRRYIGYGLTGSTREQVTSPPVSCLTRASAKRRPLSDSTAATRRAPRSRARSGRAVSVWLAIAHGQGANGKTTLLKAAVSILGDYSQSVPMDTFLASRHTDTARPDLARLRGARLVAAVESESGRRFAEALVKQVTGGDVVVARRLYREHFEFTPTFKLVIVTNHRPTIRGTDHAIWRRVRLVPFAVIIPPEERDPELPDKLLEERAGILAWAVEGCAEWRHVRASRATGAAGSAGHQRGSEGGDSWWHGGRLWTLIPRTSPSARASRKLWEKASATALKRPPVVRMGAPRRVRCRSTRARAPCRGGSSRSRARPARGRMRCG